MKLSKEGKRGKTEFDREGIVILFKLIQQEDPGATIRNHKGKTPITAKEMEKFDPVELNSMCDIQTNVWRHPSQNRDLMTGLFYVSSDQISGVKQLKELYYIQQYLREGDVMMASTRLKESRSQVIFWLLNRDYSCLLYTSPSPRDKRQSRMPSSA